MKSYAVFHLDGERGLRGGERQLLYLACALRARGHRNVVVCRKDFPLSREAQRLGLERLHLPFLTEWDPITALSLSLACGKAQGPLLHAHTAHAASVAALAGWLGRIPWVVHRRVDFMLRGPLSRRFKYQPAGRVIAVSKAIQGILQEEGLPPGRTAVVPDGIPVGEEECRWAGIEPDRFSPPTKEEKACLRRELSEEFDIPSEATWVGNLAALVPHKDHDTLIAAALLVLIRRPKTVFLIAGEGPEQGRLLKKIQRMGLVGRVLLVGQRRDAAGFLKALDLFVLSSWGEGMGSVLLEAGACGLPIAATDAGGIPEIVEDKASGLLCPARDPEALAANILRLIEDWELAAGLCARARKGLVRFGLSRMAERMEEIYGQARLG